MANLTIQEIEQTFLKLTDLVEGGVLKENTIPEGSLKAINSQFYNTMMADGNIYNPYLVRRWLPAQFKRMMRQDSNIDKMIKKNYNWDYVYKWLLTETEKLAWLKKHDKVAFEERKMFLNGCEVYRIMYDYKDTLLRYISELAKNPQKNKRGYIKIPYVKGTMFVGKLELVALGHNKTGYIVNTSTEYQTYVDRLVQTVDKLRQVYAFDYAKIHDILVELKPLYIPLKKKFKLSPTFIRAFKKAGAYYTLKNYVLFDNYKIYHKDGVCETPTESAEFLRTLTNKEAYVIYAILKKTIVENEMTIPF